MEQTPGLSHCRGQIGTRYPTSERVFAVGQGRGGASLIEESEGQSRLDILWASSTDLKQVDQQPTLLCWEVMKFTEKRLGETSIFTLLVFSNLCFESAFPAYLWGCLCPSPPGVSFLHRDPESPHACQHVLTVFHPLLSWMPAGGKASSQAPPASSSLRELDGGQVGM